jgi:hypothetical protein
MSEKKKQAMRSKELFVALRDRMVSRHRSNLTELEMVCRDEWEKLQIQVSLAYRRRLEAVPKVLQQSTGLNSNVNVMFIYMFFIN